MFSQFLLKLTIVAGIALSSINCATAEIKPIPMPSDARLVEFSYDANDTFVVLTRPRAVTDIVIHPDEEIVGLALGDTFQWQVKDTKGHIFVKPLRPNISTSVTLVTTARSYQFTLQSSPEDGAWYQRVSFTYPQLMVIERERKVAAQRVVDNETARLDRQIVSPGVAIENLNWEYKISGNASFKPTQVFDDGKFMWIRMPKTQDMPAFFMVAATGDFELINTHLKGEYVVVQRLADRLMLKLGSEEVIVSKNKGSFSGFFK